jgi:hypothetical protein
MALDPEQNAFRAMYGKLGESPDMGRGPSAAVEGSGIPWRLISLWVACLSAS